MSLHVRTRDGSMVSNPPPYEEAAERLDVTVWACRVCGHAWEVSDRFDAERAARSCHTGIYPKCSAEGCTSRTEPHRTMCALHLEQHRLAEWLKRPLAPWDGKAMVYSETLDKWFADPDEAIDHVCNADERDEVPGAVADELEAMRLVLGEPVHARPFELSDHVRDDLPDDEYGEGPDLSSVDAAVEALNAALEALPPLSWHAGNTRLDVSTLKLPSGASHG